MITAEQARRIANSSKIINKLIKQELRSINILIKRAAQKRNTSISCMLMYDVYKEDIMKKLKEAGYTVREGSLSRYIEIDWRK